MALKVIAYPTVEPITLEEAHRHLRLDADGSPPTHDDDSLIRLQLTAAREWCEHYLGYSIAQQTVELALDEFPTEEIDLLGHPVLSIDSIKYIDEDGDEQTLDPDDYWLDTYSAVGRIFTLVALEWPETDDVVNAVKIRYQIGYSIPGESPQVYPFPASVRAAILLILGHLYENRENTAELKLEQIPLGAQALLDFWRVRRGFA